MTIDKSRNRSLFIPNDQELNYVLMKSSHNLKIVLKDVPYHSRVQLFAQDENKGNFYEVSDFVQSNYHSHFPKEFMSFTIDLRNDESLMCFRIKYVSD